MANKTIDQVVDALIEIQHELKVGKGQYNAHGGYKYRSCEDILGALKPLLHKYGIVLTFVDTIEMVGDRYYVKADVVINGKVYATAFAREEETRKGMEGPKLTGASSSYARKYALQGLFLLDDGVDADSLPPESKAQEKAPERQNSEPQTPSDNRPPPSTDGDKWFEWRIPFKKSPNYGKTLDELVAAGDMNTLTSLRDFLQDRYDPNSKWADNNLKEINFVRQAITHLEGRQQQQTPPPPAADEVDDDDVPF